MRSRAMWAMTLATTIALVCPAGLCQTSSATIDRIEEDWKLVIASPNPDEVGPQITTCMSPVSDGSTSFVAFNLNYRDQPSFQAGGLQAKVYEKTGGTVLSSSSQGGDLLDTANETIAWTQRLSLSNGVLTYAIVNGQLTTWGAFGQSERLDALTFTATISSLSGYSPSKSVAASGVGWQSNRVTSMTLVQVRYYSGGQLVATDTTARSVNLSLSQ